MKKTGLIALLALLGTLLNATVFMDTSMARVFRVFGPETFTRSTGAPAAEVRSFPVQYPGDADFTLHAFYFGVIKDLDGIVPSAVIALNGKEVVGPNEFNRNVQYIKKPVTLSEGNSLSVELHGKPGSGIRVVITGKNDEPQQFDLRDIIQPDGSNLLGSDLSYLWTVLQKPENAQAVLDVVSSNPDLFVDLPGEYLLELRIAAGSWESEPIMVRLTATAAATATHYDPFVPVPAKTRVVTGVGDRYQDYSIKVGSDTYTAPAPTSCGSPTNSGYQVLVLDRATLAKKDHRTFNVPCGRDAMTSFLGTIDDTSLVIFSSLYSAPSLDVCGGMLNTLCPRLNDFGATQVMTKVTPPSFILADGNTVNFSYSLIGISHLGGGAGIELNNYDHKPLSLGDPMNYSNISGYLVSDVNYPHNRTFAYPEYVEIKTRATSTATGVTISYGPSTCSATLPAGAAGGFQVLVLDRDTLNSFPSGGSIQSCPSAFATNSGTGVGSVSESEQKRMYDFLNGLPHADQSKLSQQYVVVIASIGSPIGYKSQYFTNLIRLIANYFGGTVGVLNQLGTTPSSYSLVGLTNPGFTAYPVGATDAAETSSPNGLKVVMHKDKQGWFKPAVTGLAATGAIGGPDFSLLSVALQEPTPWPMTNPSDPMYPQYDAAYRYISSHLGATESCPPENPGCATDIRSQYNQNPIDPDQWMNVCEAMPYPASPNPYFSVDAFNAMKLQLCGGVDQNGNYINGEFTYVKEVEQLAGDLDTLLIYLQLSQTPAMKAVYDAVKAEVKPPDNDTVLFDVLNVIRGFLTAGTSIVTNPEIKGIMGIMNGIMSVSMSLSKTPAGEDYSALDTAASNLPNAMDNLWKSCNVGKEIVLGMIKTDWGKLHYVGAKLLGEWRYSDLDKKDWEIVMKNALQVYYFKSLMPALWRIEYVDNTTIPNPTNYCYHAQCSAYDTSSTGCECLPYCGDMNHPRAPESAYWIDQFPSSRYSWYVLEKDGWDYTGYYGRFGYANFSGETGLTDILFGQGDWKDSDGNVIGPKLNLSKPVFFERWFPAEACLNPQRPSGVWNITSCTCNND